MGGSSKIAAETSVKLSHMVSATGKSILVRVVAIMASFSTIGFEPVTPEERLKAIGPTDALPVPLQRAFVPDEDFVPLPRPGPQDWLAAHPESGQTFKEFRNGKPNVPNEKRDAIYLEPLGNFPEKESPSKEMLREYAAAFFQMKVKVLPRTDFSEGTFTSRTNRSTKRRQILTGDILRWLEGRLPEDAFCLVGITMEDLYPDPSWNFVFGEASLRDRVGVYSFARYDPVFYGASRESDYQKLMLRRSAKVLTHETGHMFGLAHCIYFKCLMNGSNHLQESDARPMQHCPVCLRKLQWSIGFDVVKHYEDLDRFYQQAGFDDESTWAKRRLEKIRGDARK